MEELTKKTIKFYLTHSMKYKLRLVYIAILILIGTLFLSILTVIAQKNIIDLLVAGGEVDYVVSEALKWLLYFIIIQIVANAAWRLAEYVAYRFQPNVMRDMENDVFSKFQKHSYGFFADNFSYKDK